MTAKNQFVLVERLGKRQPRYFKAMTGIGPATTTKLTEAARFLTAEDAVRSPAMAFSLSIFRVEKAPRG